MDDELEDLHGAKMTFIMDRRYLVKDPHIYPNKATAFLQMEFEWDDDELSSMAAPAFLFENQIIITAAHNIVKRCSEQTEALQRQVA